MKKFLVVLVLVASLFCIVPSAFAERDWVEVQRFDNMIISINPKSMEYKNGKMYGWEKDIYRNDNERKKISRELHYKSTLAFVLHYMEYDVKDKTSRLLESTAYDKNGNSLATYSTPGEPSRIIPGSFGDYLFHFHAKILGVKVK